MCIELRIISFHGIGKIAVLRELRHRRRAVPFRQLRPVGSEDQRHVRELRRPPYEGAVDQHLAVRVRQMFDGPNDVGDLHLVIVDDDGEVVRRQPVGADQDEVAERLLPPRHLAADHVVDRDVAVVGDVEAQRERRPHRELRRDLLRREAPARAVVVRRPLLRLGAPTLQLQLLLRAEAAIGDAIR